MIIAAFKSYVLFCVVKHFLFIDHDEQEVTSPVSESEEGYFHSTGGINQQQDEDPCMYIPCISVVMFNGGVCR